MAGQHVPRGTFWAMKGEFKMKKWYNVELGQENAERLGAYLKKYEYKYEASACGIWSVHFEIYLNKDAASKVDSFIRSLPEF